MRTRHIVAAAVLALLLVPAGSLAAGLPRIPITLKPKAFKPTSTLQVSFTAPYIARSALPEGYEVVVTPPKGTRCKKGSQFADAPFDENTPMTIKVERRRVRPGVPASKARWCRGTWKVQLFFQGEDPTRPATGGGDPLDPASNPFVIGDYLIAERKLVVK